MRRHIFSPCTNISFRTLAGINTFSIFDFSVDIILATLFTESMYHYWSCLFVLKVPHPLELCRRSVNALFNSITEYLYLHTHKHIASGSSIAQTIPLSNSPSTRSLYVDISSSLTWQLNCTAHLCYRRYAKVI